jgi:carbon monoxide dehydrogenase subunit G
MHLLTEKSAHIQRPALAVFGYVSNMEKFGEWFPGVISIASANALDHGQQGKEYLETVSVPFRGTRKVTLQVREVRGQHFFATEGRFAPLMPRMEIELHETETNSCALTWRMFSRSNNLIVR